MASNFVAFDVYKEDTPGVFTPVASTTVKVRDVTNSANLADVATDASGHVAAGTVTPAVGTTIRFYVELGNGKTGYAEQITT